jgi:hypothetical protein
MINFFLRQMKQLLKQQVAARKIGTAMLYQLAFWRDER